MMSRLMVLNLAPNLCFKAIPTSLGFSESESDYYIRRGQLGMLEEDEVIRVRDVMERGLHRLAHTDCEGSA